MKEIFRTHDLMNLVLQHTILTLEKFPSLNSRNTVWNHSLITERNFHKKVHFIDSIRLQSRKPISQQTPVMTGNHKFPILKYNILYIIDYHVLVCVNKVECIYWWKKNHMKMLKPTRQVHETSCFLYEVRLTCQPCLNESTETRSMF